MKHDPLTLEIPADARYLTTVRLFTGSVGRQFGMPEIRLGDLMLAASDTCAWLMRWRSEQGSSRRVAISVSREDEGLLVVVESDRPSPTEDRPQVPVEDGDVHLGLALIEALTHDLRIADEENDTIVTFSFPLEAQPRPLRSDDPQLGQKPDD